MSQKTLLNSKEVNIILHRLACQLIEKHLDFSNTILIGIQPRGTFLANRLSQILKNDYQVSDLKLGFLDITFFRDDFRRNEKSLENIRYYIKNNPYNWSSDLENSEIIKQPFNYPRSRFKGII